MELTTKKLKFIEDGVVNGVTVFKAGEIYDIPVETGSVTRWLKRGAIEVFEEEVTSVLEEVKLGALELPVSEEVKPVSKKNSRKL